MTVSPEQPAEVRRVTLTNHDARPRELELTSYAEVVLAPHRDDLAHPAFGKLFLETEWVPGSGALLCRRRPRSDHEQPIWAVHVAAVDVTAAGSAPVGDVSTRPTGPGSSAAGARRRTRPRSTPASVLSGTTGPVLDPIFCLRRRVRLEPGGSAVVAFATAVAEFARRGAGAGRPVSRGQRRVARLRAGLGAQPGRAPAQRSVRRGRPPVSAAGVARHLRRLGAAGRPRRCSPPIGWARKALWRFGISGDRPIVLARIADGRRASPGPRAARRARVPPAQGARVRPGPARRGAGRLRRRAEPSSCSTLIRADGGRRPDRPAGRRLRAESGRRCARTSRILLQAAARVVLVGDRGSLASQLDRTERRHPLPGR